MTGSAAVVASIDYPRADRAARSALGVLVLLFLLIQVASFPVADHYLHQPSSDAATYLQWQGYLSRPAPDIVVIGDSRADTDIDPGTLSTELGASSYRFGIPGETPVFLRALLGRVLARPARPKAVILTLSEFQFNAGYSPDPTDDLLQLMTPFDVTYTAGALRTDPYPDRFLINATLPAVANYRLIALGIQADLDRALSPPTATPGQPAAPPSGSAVPNAAPVFAEYRQLFLANYRWSSAAATAAVGMVSDLRSARIPALLLIPPVYGLDDINPALYADFVARAHALATAIGVPLADEHDSDLKRRTDVWRDPSHLNDEGARILTRALVPLLPSSFGPAPGRARPAAKPPTSTT